MTYVLTFAIAGIALIIWAIMVTSGLAFVLGMTTFIAASLVGMAIEDQREEQAWETFAVEHSCRKIADMKDSSVYACDDGVTYWR